MTERQSEQKVSAASGKLLVGMSGCEHQICHVSFLPVLHMPHPLNYALGLLLSFLAISWHL